MRRYAFFDVDYTIYEGYLASDFNLFLVERGYAPAAIADGDRTLKAALQAGKIDYREAARRALQLTADCLNGQTTDTVEGWLTEFLQREATLFPWVPELMAYLHDQQFKRYLISAAPAFMLRGVAKTLDISAWYGTEFEQKDDRYTGRLARLLNFEHKRDLVRQLVGSTPGGWHIGFGDSLGDVDMLSVMDQAVVFQPQSRELVRLAKERGWRVSTNSTILADVREIIGALSRASGSFSS